MTTEAQKQKEMMYALQLQRALKKNWTIAFSPNEKEWPDLIVHEDDKRFGLEVREISNDPETKKGSMGKASESRNSKEISTLANGYYRKSDIPLKVGILGKICDHTLIISTLLDFAQRTEIWANERIEIQDGTAIYITHLPLKVGKYVYWEFVDDHVGWVLEVDSEFIRPFVQEKEARIEKYKIHLEDVRLLLVADRSYSSGMLEFQGDRIKIKSNFDEIYFLEYPNTVLVANS